MSKAKQFLIEAEDGLNQARLDSLNKVVGDYFNIKADFKLQDKYKSGNAFVYTTDVTDEAGIFKSVIKSMELVAIYYVSENGAALELRYQHGNLSDSGSNGKRLSGIYVAFDGDKAEINKSGH